MDTNKKTMHKKLNKVKENKAFVQLEMLDEYNELYTLLVSPKHKKRALNDLMYAATLLNNHKEALNQYCTSSTSNICEPSTSYIKEGSKNALSLHLFDESTNEEHKLIVDEYTFNRAQDDLQFAATLLNKHKEALNQQSKNAVMAPDIPNAEGQEEQFSKFPNDFGMTINESDEDDGNIDVNDENELDEQSTPRNSRHIWTQDETKLLISLYKEHDHNFSSGLLSHRKFWRKIVSRFHDKGYTINCNQCITKMDTLNRKYKQTKDHNNQSGNDRKTFLHYEELDEIFHKKSWIKPLSLAGSNLPLSVVDVNMSTTSKRPKLSRQSEKMEYLEKCLDEKRLRREATEAYRSKKLSIMEELVNTLKKS